MRYGVPKVFIETNNTGRPIASLCKQASIVALRALLRQHIECRSSDVEMSHLTDDEYIAVVDKCLRLDLDEQEQDVVVASPNNNDQTIRVVVSPSSGIDLTKLKHYVNYETFLKMRRFDCKLILKYMCRTVQSERQVERMRLIQCSSEPLRQIVTTYL